MYKKVLLNVGQIRGLRNALNACAPVKESRTKLPYKIYPQYACPICSKKDKLSYLYVNVGSHMRQVHGKKWKKEPPELWSRDCFPLYNRSKKLFLIVSKDNVPTLKARIGSKCVS